MDFASFMWAAAEVGDSAIMAGMMSLALILANVVMKLVERRGTGNGNGKKTSVPPPPKPDTDPILVDCHVMLKNSADTTKSLAHKVGETLAALKETQTYIRQGTENTLVTQTILREWIVAEKARRDALRETGEMMVPGYGRGGPGGPV